MAVRFFFVFSSKVVVVAISTLARWVSMMNSQGTVALEVMKANRRCAAWRSRTVGINRGAQRGLQPRRERRHVLRLRPKVRKQLRNVQGVLQCEEVGGPRRFGRARTPSRARSRAGQVGAGCARACLALQRAKAGPLAGEAGSPDFALVPPQYRQLYSSGGTQLRYKLP